MCKIDPSSGSTGVDFVKTKGGARKIVQQVFSGVGRNTHLPYSKQREYVYFQEYIPNDGYDIRAIVVKNWVFGYYRKVLAGDYRASGMNLVEKRGLPGEAMKIALKVNEVIKSPILVVDMMHGVDGEYYIIEYSPFCQMETPEQLHVNGVPGKYVFDDDGHYSFQEGKYWLHELALREFLLGDYLPKVLKRDGY
jgi:glutathione synthase/RimK-type ligase-like ATP-grasp enzyme